MEKAVQTLQAERSRQRRGFTAFQEQEKQQQQPPPPLLPQQQQQGERRRPQMARGDDTQKRRGTGTTSKCGDLQQIK